VNGAAQKSPEQSVRHTLSRYFYTVSHLAGLSDCCKQRVNVF